MVYNLTLAYKPFHLIKEGNKVVEMRLNTVERQKIKIGDILHFSYESNTLDVRVTNIRHFLTFKELYESFPKEKLGYLKDEECFYHDMEIYYSLDDITKFGVIAFEIERI